MTAAHRIVATVAGVDWTARDIALRERTMREPADRVATFHALDPAELAARVERDGAEQVALELGVRVATVRGEVPTAPRVVLEVDLSSDVAPAPATATPASAPARRARMLPRCGERRPCAHEAACLLELARLHPDATGASCPAACPHFAPRDVRADRDHLAASRPGDGF